MSGRFTRYRHKPLAAAVATLATALGVAITIGVVGFRAEFTGGIYSGQFDSLARSFSITKAQPHGIRATGIESLRDSDVRALREDMDPSVVEHVIPIAQGRAVLRRGAHGFSGGVIGGSEDYLTYLRTPLLRGSMFTAEQVRNKNRVILLGPGVVKALFPHDPETALGSQVRVGRLTFTVIGLVGKDITGGNSSVSIAPVSTVRGDLLGGIRTVGTIGVVARSAAAVPSASRQATEILQQRHGPLKTGLQNDFSITTFSSDRLALAHPFVTGVLWFAGCVAAFCFLLATLATAGLHRGPGSARGLLAGAVRDALIGTVVGAGVGGLGCYWASYALAGVAPALGAPRLVTVIALACGIGFGLAVGVCAAGIALARRPGRARPAAPVERTLRITLAPGELTGATERLQPADSSYDSVDHAPRARP